MNTTASRTRKAIQAAARVISLAKCGCVAAHGKPCAGCEDLAGAALAAADNTAPAVVTVEAQIRQAYMQIALPGEWAKLTDLRALLTDLFVDRDDVDNTLAAMQSRQDALLIPEENQKTLTEADRAAAIHFGGQARHLILIKHP